MTLEEIVDQPDFEKLSVFLTELVYEFLLYKKGIHFTKKGIILETFSEKQDLELRMVINVNFIPTRAKGDVP